MNRILFIYILFIITPFSLIAQVKPFEGAQLNYTIIGFSFPKMAHARHYTVQIASGNYNNEDSFRKNIAVTVNGDDNKIIARVPSFGKEYTWRTVYHQRHSETIGKLYHFSTLTSKWVNPDSVRLRITTAAIAHKDDYVFMDGNKALYDMEGNAVWFLPKIEKNETAEHSRDIKITPFGTLTLLIVDQVYEINYDATILWKGPGKGGLTKKMDSVTNLHHHEMTRLENGHYMTFGFEHAFWPLSIRPDSTILAVLKDKIIRDSNNNYFQDIVFGKLIEYDSTGHIVWQWLSSDYFKKSDLYARRLDMNLYDLDDTHANAFYFDEKAKTICISFRNLNRVVKIQYPSGKVLNTFGKLYVPGAPRSNLPNGMFCGQHSCRESQDGYLYVFNNNTCNPALTPTIVMMRESSIKKDSLEKVWQYDCPMDELTPKEKSVTVFSAGGNVYELPDKTIFCCMGSEYGKTLIVSRNKKILWCAQPEKWNSKDSKWVDQFEYRGSIITPAQLEKLIWGEPLNN